MLLFLMNILGGLGRERGRELDWLGRGGGGGGEGTWSEKRKGCGDSFFWMERLDNNNNNKNNRNGNKIEIMQNNTKTKYLANHSEKRGIFAILLPHN